MRLNKFISSTGFCSRREADELIKQEKVRVNGNIEILGCVVGPDDKVEVNGKELHRKNNNVYIALNKPVGITCTTERHIKGNIIDFVNHPERIFPIGRLDKDSEGLILLTNDGRITDRLLNPKYEHDKEYVVKSRDFIKESQLKAMEKGMSLEGIDTAPCKTKVLGEKSFAITISEGQKHQIRRMCDALTMPIDTLKRVRIMNIMLGKLEPNEYRKIEGEELKKFLTSLSLA